MAKKRKKRRGHFCWSCCRILPNQGFSGPGHARHLCKECSRLGKEELNFRQDMRNLERLVTWEGIIGRRKRKAFNRFLDSPDPRIRQYAAEFDEEDRIARAFLRNEEYEHEAGGAWQDKDADAFEIGFDESARTGSPCAPTQADVEDDDIPF